MPYADRVRKLTKSYRVDREIARGGSGRIFLARTHDGTQVALKVLHPELQVSVAADRFLREIDECLLETLPSFNRMETPDAQSVSAGTPS